jgi:hypothetical protein
VTDKENRVIVGLLGMSNLVFAVEGANNSSLWPDEAIQQYGGGVCNVWAAEPDSRNWRNCQVKWATLKGCLAEFGADEWLVDIGAKVPRPQKKITAEIGVILTRLRALSPAPIRLSAVNSYAEDTVGYEEIAWRECRDAVTDAVAHDPSLHAGPVFTTLTKALTIADGIHQNDLGKQADGLVLDKTYPRRRRSRSAHPDPRRVEAHERAR